MVLAPGSCMAVDEGVVLRAEVQRSCVRLQQLESTVDLLQRRLDEWGRLTLEMQAGMTDIRLKAVAFENSAKQVHKQTRDMLPAEGILCKMAGKPHTEVEAGCALEHVSNVLNKDEDVVMATVKTPGGPWYTRQRRTSRVEADLQPKEDSAVAEDRSTGTSCTTEAEAEAVAEPPLPSGRAALRTQLRHLRENLRAEQAAMTASAVKEPESSQLSEGIEVARTELSQCLAEAAAALQGETPSARHMLTTARVASVVRGLQGGRSAESGIYKVSQVALSGATASIQAAPSGVSTVPQAVTPGSSITTQAPADRVDALSSSTVTAASAVTATSFSITLGKTVIQR